MKKITHLLLAAGIIFVAGSVFACGKEGMMGDGKMMDHSMMKMRMHEMHEMMEKASMVPSNDGGVIVMMGHMLYKYDKNLNLVKGVELKCFMDDKEGMKDMKMCPIGRKMTEKKDGAKADMKEDAGHEAHH